jgi:hypothetical protein
VEHRNDLFPFHKLSFPPGTLDIQGHPTPFLGAVVPVLVVLEEDLQPLAFDDIEDAVVV